MSGISNLTTTNAPLWESSQNHGPSVSVITWFLIITSFLSVLARIATRFAVVRQLRADDLAILIGLVFSIGQSVTTSLQAANGLGQHMHTISASHLVVFQKSTYASGFLYVGGLAFVKLSISLYLNTLSPVRLHKRIILGLSIFIGVWAATCFLVIAFQCQLPHSWTFIGGKCVNLVTFWTYVHVLNILTDVALIALPWAILSRLQVQTRRKAVIIGCFVVRSMVIAMTIVQIYFLHTRYAGSSDPTFDLWLVVLITEIVQSLSLITACVPYLKPFLEALETGMIRANAGTQIHGYGSGYGSGSGHRFKPYGATSKPSSKANRGRQHSNVRLDNLGFPPGGSNLGANSPNTQTVTVTSKRHTGDSDGDSQSSESKIIKKTVGWSVTTDEGTTQLPPNTHFESPPDSQHGSYGKAV